MDLPGIVIIVLGAAAAMLACWGLNARERGYAMVAFLLHVAASFGQVWLHEVYYTNGNDAVGYQKAGTFIGELLGYNFSRFAPEVVRLFLHLDTNFGISQNYQGTSSGTAAALAGIFAYMSGPSLLDLFLITTWISWFGQLCWYRVAREELPAKEHTLAILGCLYVPSAIFWGAAFAKEAIVMGGFGVLGLSTYRLLRNRRLFYVPGVLFGVVVVAMLKAYTLVPFVLAVSTFIFVARARAAHDAIRFRLSTTLIAVAVSVAGVAAMGSAFPEYSAENISQTVNTQQQAWDDSLGNSSIERVGGEAPGLAKQVAYVPLALINSFFRPAIFEATGGPALGAALETTLLALAVLGLLSGKTGVIRTVTSSPLLAASVVFSFVFAVAVGLTTSNLGSLSRYRVPMLPFVAMLMLVLHKRRIESRDKERAASRRRAQSTLIGARSSLARRSPPR